MDSGTRLGHYEILGPLGAGGMGEVYRALDSTLDREVAIKVLPADFASDQDRLARFEREAKLLASLNHANIAGIYGFQNAGGVRFIAMELVEGETLADRIAGGGAIEVEEALEIARQIAEALEAAHEAGIVHRDLKPANVKVTPDGKVKVLDFGLAKAYGADSSGSGAAQDISASPTLAAATGAGMILGTAPYMSPEQARGKPVDHRADIWAFGCLLLEMLSGRRVFEGETVSDTLAAVLRAEPDMSAIPAAAPGHVRRLLRRALEKDPRKRLQHIGDARVEIEEALSGAKEETPAAAGTPAGSDTTPVRPWVAGLLLAGGLALGALGTWQLVPSDGTSKTEAPTRLSIMADLYGGRGRRHFALSPDGRTLAYVGRSGQLFVRQLDEFDAQPLDGTSGARTPFFSPDGAWVAYWADGAIYKISPQGGATQRITSASVILGAGWTADGRIVFSEFVSPLRIVSAQGGTARDLLEIRSGANQMRPYVLPGDAGVLFETQYQIALASLETGEWSFLPGTAGATAPAYSPSGHVLYRGPGSNLWAVPFDLDTLQVTGDPFPASADTVRDFDIAENGTVIFDRLRGGAEQDLVWVGRDGTTEVLPFDPAPYQSPRLSPDGSQIAVTLSDEIWVLDIARSTSTRLTAGGVLSRWPVWTHGGTRIAFTADMDGKTLGLHWKAPGGSASAERLIPYTGLQIPISWSEPSQELAFYEMDGPYANIRVLRADGAPEDLVVTRYDDRSPRFSPDGRRLAYVSNETGRDEIYIVPYPSLEPRVLVSPGGGIEPVWSRDGSELYYRDDAGLMAVPVPAGDSLEPGAPSLLFEHGSLLFSILSRGNANYDTSPDGRFLMVQGPQSDAYPRLSVVLNWADELERQATSR